MTCNICGRSGASIVIQHVMDDKVQEIHICNQCAQKYNLNAADKDIGCALDELFNNLAQKKAAEQSKHGQVCPDCGTSLMQINTNKQLGCPLCFFFFRDTVVKLMKKEKKDLVYTGQVPDRLETAINPKVSLYELQKKLKKALKHEEYELAAYYRDRINEIGVYS